MLLLSFLLIALTGIAILNRKKELCNFSTERTLPLRGILALLIVLHHVAQKVMKTDGAAFFWDELCDWGGPVVTVFFFMSGYGLMVSIKRKGAAYLDGFLGKRLTKIAIPLLLCSILYIVDNQYITTGGGKILTLTLADWNRDYPLLPTAWFAIAILIYYVAFYVCARISIKTHYIVALMWMFTLVYIWLMHRYNFYGYWYRTVCALNVGMTVSLFERQITQTQKKHRLPLLLAVTATWIAVSAVLEYKYQSAEPLIYLQNASFSVLAYLLVVCLGFPSSKTLRWLGGISYEIYLVQGAVILTLFGYVGQQTFPFLLLTYAVTLPLSLCVHKLSKRANNAVSRLLNKE